MAIAAARNQKTTEKPSSRHKTRRSRSGSVPHMPLSIVSHAEGHPRASNSWTGRSVHWIQPRAVHEVAADKADDTQ